ncbi:hypothetical protein BGZ82_004406, partial [Podila clonocystis]
MDLTIKASPSHKKESGKKPKYDRNTTAGLRRRKASSSTVNTYAVYQRNWRAYCDEHFRDLQEPRDPIQESACVEELNVPYYLVTPEHAFAFMLATCNKRLFKFVREGRQVRLLRTTDDIQDGPSLREAMETAPTDAHGRKLVAAPVTMAYVTGTLSALCDLYHVQRQKGWIACDSPRSNPEIAIIIRNHAQRLMFDALNTTSDLTGNCPLRDAYTLRQYAQMLEILWKTPIQPR